MLRLLLLLRLFCWCFLAPRGPCKVSGRLPFPSGGVRRPLPFQWPFSKCCTIQRRGRLMTHGANLAEIAANRWQHVTLETVARGNTNQPINKPRSRGHVVTCLVCLQIYSIASRISLQAKRKPLQRRGSADICLRLPPPLILARCQRVGPLAPWFLGPLSRLQPVS